MQDIYVGRQPIYGPDLDVFAYELLFRGGEANYADFAEGDRATSEVILNAFTEIGLDRVVGERKAFLNLTRGFIVGDYPLPVPADRVVLEVFEEVRAEEPVLAGLRRLKDEGYEIALDDFVFSDQTLGLLPFADYVKVDCLGLDEEGIRAQVELLRPYPVILLAEKIETPEQFDVCRVLGFELFQGFFLSRPNVIRDKGMGPDRINMLQQLAELQDPSLSFERACDLVSRDVVLSYKMLRFVNSQAYGLRREIHFIREALVFLGLDVVRNLASLALLTGIEEKPHGLVTTAMLRARMCEELARSHGGVDPGQAFAVGLFSSLDVLVDAPLVAILERLSLSEPMRVALKDRAGDLGALLTSTLAYERGDWQHISCLGLSHGEIKDAFLSTVKWVEAVEQTLLMAEV